MSDSKTQTPVEKPACGAPDRYAIARTELLERLIDHIAGCLVDRRPWEGVVYPLGKVIDHPLAPGRKAFLADDSFLISIPVALRYRPLPERERICCAWKRPGPPLHVFLDRDGAKRFIELLGQELKRADETGKPWQATVRPMGALEQPDPRQYHKSVLAHDGSFIVLILIGRVGEKLPQPRHFKVWWPQDVHVLPGE